MIIIGEKLNSSIPLTREAVEKYDTATVLDIAKKQIDCGAGYLDVNAGMFEDEEIKLNWLIDTIQAKFDIPLVLDSPSARVIKGVIHKVKKKPIINSITYEKQRFNDVLPLVLDNKTGVIALCMDDNGMPETVDGRLSIVDSMVNEMVRYGVLIEDIYLDPMVRPVATGPHYGKLAIDTIKKTKENFPNIHISCGLSNISFGLPVRRLINSSFLTAAMTAGLDTPILDPTDKRLMSALYATRALLGMDEYCLDYLDKYREDELEY